MLACVCVCVCVCDVIWFGPKALPSLHYFVSIVVEFTPTHPNDPKRAKQPPKPKKRETTRKIVGKIRSNNWICFMNNPVLYLFLKENTNKSCVWFVCSNRTANRTTLLTYYNTLVIMTNTSGNSHFQ